MDRNVEVKSWVGISEGCPISYIADADAVDFTFGRGPRESFEFGFEAEALRRFLDVGAEALRQLESAAVSS